METFDPAQLQALVRDLPPTAAVLPRLMALLEDLNSSGEDVLALVRLDPALAAAILRSSRSAFYGARGEAVESLDDAISELGFKEVYRLVAMFAMSRLCHERVAAYGAERDLYWRKSLACALAMESLSGETSGNSATSYTIGLLHAIGELLVDRLIRRNGGGRALLAYSESAPLPAQEIAACGHTQTELAALAMRHWRFPAAIIEPIEYQFTPEQAPQHASLAMRLRLAKWLTYLVIGDEPTARAVNPDFHFAISIPGNSFAGMVEELRVRLLQATQVLSCAGVSS